MAIGIFDAPDRINFEQVTEAVSAGPANAAATLLSICFSLNLILFVFNLMPLPPLDGSQVVVLFLDERAAERYSQIIHQPAFRIIGLVVAWRIVGYILSPVHLLAINILYYPGHSYH
ncbi:MAG: site-2 protease family protein [Planctomycetota bacterium]|jgi:Zn-dependent protease